MMETEQLEQTFISLGFADFKWINPKNIIVANWVRMKCVYGCGDYGRACCPPNVPSIEECRDFLHEYSMGAVFSFQFEAEKGNYPVRHSRKIDAGLLKLERDLFLQGYFKSFVFPQSCCSLCDQCARSRAECKFPDQSRPSPEAFGIDVYDTVRNLGYEIEVVTHLRQTVHRFAFLLIS